jgi:polar amino acid transport system permease protein
VDYQFNFTLVWRHAWRLWWGLGLSLQIALASLGIGMVIGIICAIAYTDGGRAMRTAVAGYVEFIRNTPLLLLVYLVFYGIPSVGGFAYDATTSFIATLAFYAGAQLTEVFRAGLDAVPAGVVDAGRAIGLTRWGNLVHVRLPTCLRIGLPALSNAYISLFKDTALGSVIAVPELTHGAQWINFNTFRILEVYALLTPIYLVTGWIILAALRLLERRFAIAVRA